MTDRLDELLKICAEISRGDAPSYQHNECFTAGAYDLLILKSRGEEAFKLLEALCDRYDAARSTGILSGYFELIYDLANKSGTTEIPRGLDAIIAAHPELTHEIRAWYRLAG